YSYMRATFQSGFTENSASNSSADASGAIQVERGNRIPGLPQHVLKLRFDYEWNDTWAIGASVNNTSSIYARGDENNRDVHGKISGFTVVNLDARYQLGRELELFARVNNLFDRRYANFGVIGANFFTGPNRTFGPAAGVDPATEQFRSPGVPRGAWVGLRCRWS
ncbi:MAG: TonB-dependent receptor domain-containing protein, partial [Burkholderiaceae bacterium]